MLCLFFFFSWQGISVSQLIWDILFYLYSTDPKVLQLIDGVNVTHVMKYLKENLIMLSAKFIFSKC